MPSLLRPRRLPRTLTAAAIATLAVGCGDVPMDTTETIDGIAATYTPITGVDGRCVDATGAATANETRIEIWNCNGGSNQRWAGNTVGVAGPIRIATGRCLDAQWGATTDGTPIQLWDCNGTNAQRWTLQSSGEIVGPGGKCLSTAGNASAEGTALVLATCHGASGQIWHTANGGSSGGSDAGAHDSGTADAASHDSGAADAGTRDSGTPPSTSPSGQPMPVGDIAGWHQIFADDFTTNVPLGSFPSAVSSRWGAYPDGWSDTSHHGTYMPSRVISISGGVLNMHLHTEGGVHMVSAPTPVLPSGMRYGRYVARFRADPVPGYKTAWLLWPDSGVWPRDGEIDFPEGDLDSTIGAFMHRQNGASGGDQDAYGSSLRYPTWHTMVLEWTATACRFELDGTTLGASTSRIPDTAMHWVLQTETALSGAAPSDSAEGNVQIDWVTVYAPQ